MQTALYSIQVAQCVKAVAHTAMRVAQYVKEVAHTAIQADCIAADQIESCSDHLFQLEERGVGQGGRPGGRRQRCPVERTVGSLSSDLRLPPAGKIQS